MNAAEDPRPEPPERPGSQTPSIRARALRALEEGDFAWLSNLLEQGDSALDMLALNENLRVYQAELEIQNAELRSAQLAAERLATRYTTFFNRIPLAVLAIDRNGLILDANQEAARLFGLRNRHLRQHFLRRLVIPEDSARLDDTLAVARSAGSSMIGHLRFHTADGSGFDGELHIERLPDLERDQAQYLCAMLDLTAHLRYEAVLERARASLEESETRYRILADYSADWDGWVGSDGLHRYVSPACEGICGHPPADFLADAGLMERLVHPDDRARWNRHWREVSGANANAPPARLEVRLLRSDGEVRWIEHRCRPVHAPDGTCLGRRDTNHDITLRKQAELSMERDKRRAEALLELQRIAGHLDEFAFMQRGQELAESLTESRIAFIHFVNEDQETIELVAWSRATLAQYCQAAADKHYPVSAAGIWADAMRWRTPVICNDYANASEKRGLPAGHAELVRFVCVPVMEGDRVRMMAGVGNKEDPYDATDVESVQLIANTIWNIVRQRRADAILRQTARAFESAAEGVIITDTAANILSVNRAFTEITGYPTETVIGRNPRILQSGRHDPDFYRALWTSLLEKGRWQGEIWNRRANGEHYPEWLTIANVTDDSGRTTHYVAVFGDISELKRSQERIAFLAHHDPLTQLPNRALFQDRLEQAIRDARRHDEGLALLFVDLDHFKVINDSLGHAVGDALLRQAARRMQSQLRGNDTLARIGGDEFVVLLAETATAQEAGTVAAKLLHALTLPFPIDAHELFVTASIGISLYPGDGDQPDLLLRNADLAMYRAKSLSRNAIHFYCAELAAAAVERLELGNALRGALERGEFTLHYQPQVSLTDGALVAVEALLRWRHPRWGLVPPAHFVPVAEELGLIPELGSWVLRAACEQMLAWDRAGLRVPRIAVNLAVQQLERDSFVALVAETLAAAGLTADRLELEVTESMIMRQAERAIDTLDGLRRLGVAIAVDDFGTGYSSLGYLRRLPINCLKIDYSFVRDIGSDRDDEIIVRAIIGLGQSLGLDVVAEGIEAEPQADFLLREGCRVGQGYLYSRPLPADDLPGYLERAGR